MRVYGIDLNKKHAIGQIKDGIYILLQEAF